MAIKPQVPRFELGKMLTLIHGDPKVGKSTLASEYPKSCFIATEAGLNMLDVRRWENQDGKYVVESWEDFLRATAEVVADPDTNTIIIDTIGNMINLVDAFICKQNGEDFRSNGKLSFGKGGAMIVNEVRRYLTKLTASGKGIVLIAHTCTREISTPAGQIQKRVPFIPCDSKTLDIYNAIIGSVDLILFCDKMPNDSRVIKTKGGSTFEAGDRSGSLPAEIQFNGKGILKEISKMIREGGKKAPPPVKQEPAKQEPVKQEEPK